VLVIVGVIDLGSNTVRLLVARTCPRGLVTVERTGSRLGLGEQIERSGRISGKKISKAAAAVEELATRARRHDVDALAIVVTAPGRQSENGDELVAAIGSAARTPVRVLSPADEGRLTFFGAVSSAEALPATVAVSDVGGASTELAVGTPASEPTWLHSVDLGALRLTERHFAEAVCDETVDRARDDVRALFASLAPPPAATALAAGGTARALRKLVGPTLGREELLEAEKILRTEPHDRVAQRHGIKRARLRVLFAGTLIHAELQRRLGVELTVARGGLREGVALEQLSRLAA
jgi:exopolyphosphatase/guanosine-5'-triphosphate,3'-diphosphate pyrophosphatase